MPNDAIISVFRGYMAVVLGKGCEGEVYKDFYNEIPCAIKKPNSNKSSLESESKMLSRVGESPFFSKFYVFHQENIYMELIVGHTLLTHYDNDDLDAVAKKMIFRRLLEGVAYLAEEGIVHGDLKMTNIILKNGSNNPVIIDFGIARQIPRDGYKKELNQHGAYVNQPPETLLALKLANPRRDVWALACIVYRLSTRECFMLAKPRQYVRAFASIVGRIGPPPQSFIKDHYQEEKMQRVFTENAELKREPLRCAELTVTFADKPGLLSLLQKMFVYNPKERIDASYALKESYFATQEE
jgi:serine/threonine protein kinase